MGKLRSEKMDARYDKHRAGKSWTEGCDLCNKSKSESKKEFRYWRIIKAKFPWDRIAKTQDLIIPKRHVTEEKLNQKEQRELLSIKPGYINQKYELIVEATNKMKSIPKHFHLHLVVIKNKLN